MSSNPSFDDILATAKAMQAEMEAAQADMADWQATGTATVEGYGVDVTVVMNGDHLVQKVHLPASLDGLPSNALAEALSDATNRAVRGVAEQTKQQVIAIGKKLNGPSSDLPRD